MTAPPVTIGQAREEFLAMVRDIRPKLHRYCARLTGSVIEGEDIVQETLARAFYTLSLSVEQPKLEPWLFRIAHNAALDFLKSHGRKHTELSADLTEIAGFEEAPDPVAVRAAISRFLTLPVSQRSAVILKDVLGYSLEETAETMGATVMAVKAALVRGRAGLRAGEREALPMTLPTRDELERYAKLFNTRDWDGLRALVSDDCRLDLVAKAERRGKQVREYFARYEKESVVLSVVRLEGQLALAAQLAGTTKPSYFVLLEWEAGRVQSIRDFRYVPYIAIDAELEGDA